MSWKNPVGIRQMGIVHSSPALDQPVSGLAALLTRAVIGLIRVVRCTIGAVAALTRTDMRIADAVVTRSTADDGPGNERRWREPVAIVTAIAGTMSAVSAVTAIVIATMIVAANVVALAAADLMAVTTTILHRHDLCR